MTDENNWIDASKLLPNFCVYGFQTGRRLEVRYEDGKEELVIYQGYGMFGKDNREDVTHWRPDLKVEIK